MGQRQDTRISIWPHTGLTLLALGLALMPACSRDLGAFLAGQKAETRLQLPFDSVSDKSGISPTRTIAGGEIPTGATITVRLQASLSSVEAQPGEVFQASVDEPLVLDGQAVVPRGAPVLGRVVAAQSSTPGEAGYLRLTLSSLVVKGKTWELHTSFVFAKGGSHESDDALMGKTSAANGSGGDMGRRKSGRRLGDVKFSTDRRLTFHLVQMLPLPG